MSFRDLERVARVPQPMRRGLRDAAAGPVPAEKTPEAVPDAAVPDAGPAEAPAV
jgi:hypothetical protein